MQERRLTVSKLRRSTRIDHPWEPRYRVWEVPFLRMRGNWLEAAGFEIGKRVQVEVSSGRLVLTVER